MLMNVQIHEKALTLRDARVVFFTKDKSVYEVVDVESGDVLTMSEKQFRKSYVLSGDVPPSLKQKLRDVPSWREWKAARRRKKP